jgi:hypothetical protein
MFAVRKPKTFDANITVNSGEDAEVKYPSVRELYGPDENVYIMDAKTHGNIGRYLNVSGFSVMIPFVMLLPVKFWWNIVRLWKISGSVIFVVKSSTDETEVCRFNSECE